MSHWSHKSFFYHMYPLGLCGVLRNNGQLTSKSEKLKILNKWIDHIKSLHCNAIYLGPVFASSSHGYDTIDYFTVDSRLGTNNTLREFIHFCHENEIKVVLDGVFNHVGREFWAFQDVQKKLKTSQYKDWFYNINFHGKSVFGDPFTYEGWYGHYDLVKLNHKNEEVVNYLLNVTKFWIDEFNIDGLRLDAADCIDISFLESLAAFAKSVKSDLWLMGEVVHGDYRIWANDKTLDSVTNYECYKGLYSSHNDSNYFEIAYSLNRLFGNEGIYKNLHLYNFADNHDVNRVASQLHDYRDLYPLHILLFTMPGIPSVYYGSEWGINGEKRDNNDDLLRPAIDIADTAKDKDLLHVIRSLALIRNNNDVFTYGDYQQLYINHKQFAFMRTCEECSVIILVNSEDQDVSLSIPIEQCAHSEYVDVLNNNECINISNNTLNLTLWKKWGRILIPKR